MPDPTTALAAAADELLACIRAAAVGRGLLEVLVKRLLDLHAPEVEGLNLGHEDCDECDEWKHEGLVCRDCRGTEDELWTYTLWPCPTVQHIANTLRAYPDQRGLVAVVTGGSDA